MLTFAQSVKSNSIRDISTASARITSHAPTARVTGASTCITAMANVQREDGRNERSVFDIVIVYAVV